MDPNAVGNGNAVGRGMRVLDGSRDRRRGTGSFGGELRPSYCNRWGLCDAALPKLLLAVLVCLCCSNRRILRHSAISSAFSRYIFVSSIHSHDAVTLTTNLTVHAACYVGVKPEFANGDVTGATFRASCVIISIM